MSDLESSWPYGEAEHKQYMEERKWLIDAAREGARSFDQAILAFGSAAFAASIAFVKDVAPHPPVYTLKWLFIAWLLFACGLLSILLSFMFGQKACNFEIEKGAKALNKTDVAGCRNRWGDATTTCNVIALVLLFSGLIIWTVFAAENLVKGATEVEQRTPNSGQEQRGYVPPPPPPKAPPQQQQSSGPSKK